MWATTPRYWARYSRVRMASPRPPGPLAYAERVQRGVPIEVQPLDAEHPQLPRTGSSAASLAGPWPCGQSAAVNSASRGRKLTGKPVTESNLSFRAPAQISVRYVVVGWVHDYRCRRTGRSARPLAGGVHGDRRAAHPQRGLQGKVIQAGRDERTLLRLSRISIARCADLIRSSAYAWGPLSWSVHPVTGARATDQRPCAGDLRPGGAGSTAGLRRRVVADASWPREPAGRRCRGSSQRPGSRFEQSPKSPSNAITVYLGPRPREAPPAGPNAARIVDLGREGPGGGTVRS